MPTSRALTFLIAACVVYLFANQTQVGWLYVMAALLVGIVLAGKWLSRGALRGMTGERRVGAALDGEFYEGDAISIRLTLHKRHKAGASQLRAVESCPLVAPDSQWRTVRMFIPSLPGGERVQFDYPVTLDRRGLHSFPPLQLNTQAPFGFFKQRTTLTIPTRVLVYPEVQPVHRLELLDKRLAAQLPRPRAGIGYEAMGVRPFRPGDSPRHIHWRSVARTGELMTKEFADEAQPGLTLVLDLYHHPYPDQQSKYVPFEWAVKIAASFGEYAQRKGYPLYLVADNDALAVPAGPVSWFALLQYLARVQPISNMPLPFILDQWAIQTMAVVLIAWPDPALIEPLIELKRRADVLPVVIDAETFPAGGLPANAFVDALNGARLKSCLIRFDQQWADQLSSQL